MERGWLTVDNTTVKTSRAPVIHLSSAVLDSNVRKECPGLNVDETPGPTGFFPRGSEGVGHTAL